MPRLIAAFLRHGDYKQLKNIPSALQPFALTTDGQQQAETGAEMIHDYCQENAVTIHPVVNCSTSLRAWQTALEIKIKAEAGTSQTLYLESHDNLCERSVGSVANLTIEQIETLLQDDPRFELPPKNWKSDSYYCLPFSGAESLISAGQRVAKHIQHNLSQLKPQIHQDTLKIFVGHGASFRHAVHHLNLLKFEQIAQLSMFHAQPVFLEYLEDQSFQHIAGKWKIRNKKETPMD